MRRLLLAALLVASCKSKPTQTEDAGVSIATASAPTSTALGSAVAREVDQTQQLKLAAYVHAIARGRKATLAKNWPEASAAFDEALANKPRDARALAEKGYAELLEKNFHSAERDLAEASATTDAKLGAQIWFNLGLVDEGLQQDDDALVDFWFANKLQPSRAAQAKLAGRSVCPVRASHDRSAAVHGKSWLDVAQRLYQDGNEAVRDAAPTTEAAAKAALLDAGAKPFVLAGKGEFWSAHVGDIEKAGYKNDFLVQVAGGDFWTYPDAIGGQYVMNMVTSPEPTITIDTIGRWVHVLTSSQDLLSDLAYCTHQDGGAEFECTGADDEVIVTLGSNHATGPTQYVDHVFDPDAHARVLELTDAASGRFALLTDGGKGTSLRAAGDAIELAGLGCNLRFERGDGGL